jgi:hypothetical protein
MVMNMSYDKVWMQCGGHQEKFQERNQAMGERTLADFDIQFDRLYRQGHFVVLEAGGNFMREELFLFEHAADARECYDRGFVEWESPNANRHGCGFQTASFHENQQGIASKSVDPMICFEDENQFELAAGAAEKI